MKEIKQPPDNPLYKPKILNTTYTQWLAFILLAMGISLSSGASTETDGEQHPHKSTTNYSAPEKPITGWAVSFDNDVLVPVSRDQDYTYGSSLTVSGSATSDYLLSLDGPLTKINQFLGINQTPSHHSAEFGLYGFTPEDKTSAEVLNDDRPFASIVYWSNTQEIATASPNTIWRSTLTLGVLGLDLVGNLQNTVHEAIDSDRANGWRHQVSDGGELTVHYSAARQHLWDVGNPNIELKTTTQTSLGYITEMSWGTSLRIGRISSRWQSYNPELTSYGEHTNQTTHESSAPEHYFSMGAAVKFRAYNAFLQGQFRHSPVTYDYSELNHTIVELWAGYTYAFKNGYQISYLLRGHSSEIKQGDGNRAVMWGGLTLSKKY
jgi:hypothetical protein